MQYGRGLNAYYYYYSLLGGKCFCQEHRKLKEILQTRLSPAVHKA